MKKINYINGDVLSHKVTGPTLLIHIVNNHGVMGAGVALSIAEKWPVVEDSYKEWHRSTITSLLQSETEQHLHILENFQNEEADYQLGEIQLIEVSSNLYVVNMLAQVKPGGTYIQIGESSVYLRPIRLDSLYECLLRVASVAKSMNAEVIGPKFGCGLARANWETEVEPLVISTLCKYDVGVTIYEPN